MHRLLVLTLCLGVCFGMTFGSVTFAQEHVAPPTGFVLLFNGKDLSGWRGLIEPGDPKRILAMSPKEKAVAQRDADARMHQHWRVEAGENL